MINKPEGRVFERSSLLINGGVRGEADDRTDVVHRCAQGRLGRVTCTDTSRVLLAPNGDPVPRVLDTATARQLGFTRSSIHTQLNNARWQTLVRGLYLARPDLPTRLDWVAAGYYIAGRGAVLSGWDAVRLRGLGPERPPTDEVLLLSARGTHRCAGSVRVRPSRRPLRCSRVVIPGLGLRLVAATARALADTALDYRTLAPVRAMVTAAVQRNLCLADDLADELASGPRNDSGHFRTAVADVLEGAASIGEAELAEAMRKARLPSFELNVPILDERGAHIATADVLWRSLRAVLEVDSREHHFLEPQWKGTMNRHNLLTRYGLALTHYPPAELKASRDRVMTEIGAWLRGRAAELGLPFPPPVRADLTGTPFVLRRLLHPRPGGSLR